MFSKLFLLGLFIVVLPHSLWAQKMSIVAGMGQMSMEAESGLTPSSDGGYQFGTLFYSNLNSGLGSRVGVLFTERDFTLSAGSAKTTAKFSYLQVPLTATLAMTPHFALFGGAELNLNVSKSCSEGCTLTGVKAADLGLNVGAMLTFMDSFGAEIFYEKPFNKIVDHTSNPYVVGINLMYLIE